MAEVVHFKTLKAQSRQHRVEVPGAKASARLPELRAVATTHVSAAKTRFAAAPSVVEFLRLVIVPLVILLCSIAAFAISMEHLSGQPGYSARSNASPPALIE